MIVPSFQMGLCHEMENANFKFCHMSSILFAGIMVPNIEKDYILLLGYGILY